MMRKFSTVILAAVIGTGLLAGCGSPSTVPQSSSAPAEDTSLKDIQAKGEFTIGLDADFAPMGFTDNNGDVVGFDIDLAKEAAAKMGLEVQVKPIDWDSKAMELSSKKIDAIWNGFSISEERKKEVLFSDPYLSTAQVIIVKAGSPIKTKADLAGKKIALQDGSTSEDAVKADKVTYESIGDDNISRFKENSQVLMQVDSGRADAAVIDEIFVRYYLTKENMLDKYTILQETFDSEDYAVGARMEDKAFVEALNKALAECKADGTTAKISEKWFGENLVK